MSNFQKALTSLCLVLAAALVATAVGTDVRFYDRGQFQIETGEADIDVSASDYTARTALLTVVPASNTAMHDVKVYLDTGQATTGYSAVFIGAGDAQLCLARKVDGTNWRSDIASITTIIAGTSTGNDGAQAACVVFDVGTVEPTESVRVEVKVDSEATGGDCAFPYRVTYRSPKPATFTAVAN